jgi:hypothetical protein
MLKTTILGCLLLSAVVGVLGCRDRIEERYQAGYADGVEAERKAARIEPFRNWTTTVCGGNGVTVNGTHVRGGPTGCVRVASDGTVQRY